MATDFPVKQKYDKAPSPLFMAIDFHDFYEELAPHFGYETRLDTKEFDETSPNGQLMIAVCEKIIDKYFNRHIGVKMVLDAKIVCRDYKTLKEALEKLESLGIRLNKPIAINDDTYIDIQLTFKNNKLYANAIGRRQDGNNKI